MRYCYLAWVWLFAATVLAEEPPVVQQANDEAVAVEEMTVTGRRLDLSSEERRRIYERLREARALYSRNQIDEALPLLLDTAERGFKDSQAKVGHIYLQGLGDVDKDSERAVGWLGVASSGTSSPPIRNYFNDVWKRIPERYVPYFEEVVEEYKSKYGGRATGVVCKMRRPVRSHLKQLGCYFKEDVRDETRDGMDNLRSGYEDGQRIEDQRREVFIMVEQTRRAGPTR